jgi:pimeloyl-ACP methyl ester carboxylesterase
MANSTTSTWTVVRAVPPRLRRPPRSDRCGPPLLVGWSYGAAVAVHWADRNPDRVAGVVSVDGAVSCDLTGKDGRERIRRLFRRMRLLLSLASRLGWPRG